MNAAAVLESQYSDLIDLSIGDPDIVTDQRVIEAAFSDALVGHTRYTNPYGYLELRQEICQFYQEEYQHLLTPDQCMITTSASHAMWLVLEAILDDGDEVIIPSPYFTPYRNQVRLARGVPVFLETREEEAFQLNISELETLITERTKAIIINTPNNPTGNCLSVDNLEALGQLANKYDLLLIADDIYAALTFDQPFTPLMTLDDLDQRTITIGSFSKDFAMTGWRIGYIIADPILIDTIKDINENVVYSAPAISQRAALHALRLRHSIQPAMIEEYQQRVEIAYAEAQKLHHVSVRQPQGTFYLFLNIKATGLSSEEVTQKILEEAHIVVLPGNSFGEAGEGYLRIAVTIDEAKIKEAFARLAQMDIFKSTK